MGRTSYQDRWCNSSPRICTWIVREREIQREQQKQLEQEQQWLRENQQTHQQQMIGILEKVSEQVKQVENVRTGSAPVLMGNIILPQ